LNPIALERAEKGLAWLRESGPIYGLDVDKVNIDRLDLSHHCDCVLGQLQGGYAHVLEGIGFEYAWNFDANEWAEEHGFQHLEGVSYQDLTEAWKQLLTADRA
jgi:hypothetical protein